MRIAVVAPSNTVSPQIPARIAALVADRYGDDAQRAEWLPALLTMEKIASYCLTEPGVGSDAGALSTRAVPDGDERDKDVANAIRYAVDNGARIVNMSFGKSFSPQKGAVDEAVRYATERGVLLVHASGNSGAFAGLARNCARNVCPSGTPGAAISTPPHSPAARCAAASAISPPSLCPISHTHFAPLALRAAPTQLATSLT